MRLAGRGTAALLASALLLAGCSRLMFFRPNDRTYEAPEHYGLRVSDISFRADDRSVLEGWWLPADPEAGPARCTVVHAHGNAANVSRHLDDVAWLPPLGVNVLMFDYRGFGASLGKPSLDGVVEDAEAAVRTALTLPGSTPGRLLVFGQSLGGATAVRAVANLPPGAVQVLVVDSGFARYRDVAHHVAGAIKVLKVFGPVVRNTLPADEDDPVTAIPSVRVPVWIIHGDADKTVPFHQGERLYEAARMPKTFVPVAGGVHLRALERPEVREKFMEAVAACARGGAAP